MTAVVPDGQRRTDRGLDDPAPATSPSTAAAEAPEALPAQPGPSGRALPHRRLPRHPAPASFGPHPRFVRRDPPARRDLHPAHRSRRRALVRRLVHVSTVLVALACAVLLVLGAFVAGVVLAPASIPAPAVDRVSTLLDTDGSPIGTLEGPERPEQLTADELPPLLTRAVVADQDPGFSTRSAVQASGLLSAAAGDVLGLDRPGGTIEARYARQLRAATGSAVPQLQVAAVAERLRQRLPRRELLVRYLNGQYFGNGVYGVAAASRYYVGVPVADLTPAGAALLAGIADDPVRGNPVADPVRASTLRGQALRRMAAQGVLSTVDANAADASPLPRPLSPSATAGRTADAAFTGQAGAELLGQLGPDVVYASGLTVRTTLVAPLQAVLARRLAALGSSPAADAVQDASATDHAVAVAVDPRNGDVLALTTVAAPAQTDGSGAPAALDALRPLTPTGWTPAERSALVAAGLPRQGAASVRQVSTAFASLAAHGVRHAERFVSQVGATAPDGSRRLVWVADPYPTGVPGGSAVDADAAERALSGHGTPRSPRPAAALTSQPTPTGQANPTSRATAVGRSGAGGWWTGCVPNLCITVWSAGLARGHDARRDVVLPTIRDWLVGHPLPVIPAAPSAADGTSLAAAGPRPQVPLVPLVPLALPPSPPSAVAAVPVPAPSAMAGGPRPRPVASPRPSPPAPVATKPAPAPSASPPPSPAPGTPSPVAVGTSQP